MDEASQRTLVKPEACRVVEAAQPGPAGGAYTLVVQRISIQKGRIADGAEVIRLERGGGLQAFGADRNARPSDQRTLANPAVAGEQHRKNSVRKLVDGATEQVERGRSRRRATREGAPPCVLFRGFFPRSPSYEFRETA